jgi:hypothetical protein
LDVFIIDELDRAEKERVENLEVKVIVTNTIMRTIEDKMRLAETVLKSML